MGKVKNINLLLVFSLVALAAISFGPCIREIKTYVVLRDLIQPTNYVESLPYSPLFFCIVSAIEIVLVIVSNRRVLRLIGMIMHLFKMVVPFALYRMGIFLMIGDPVKTYTFSLVGYVLLAVGIVTLILYGVDFIKNGRRIS